MNLSREEASAALDEIGSAAVRVREFQGYRDASPFFILWGLVWMIANAVNDLWPRYGGEAWAVGTIVGTAVTAALIILQVMRKRKAHAYTDAERKAIRQRSVMLGCTVMGFFPAMFMVLAPLSGRQQNAFISLFWAFAYMAAGAWLGKRIFVTGLVTAVAIVVGYQFLAQHYFLWMALVGGGSLLLAGFWMRRL
jgi:hypothetical protein